MKIDTQQRQKDYNKQYSEAYTQIRAAAEKSWPEWRKTTYNVNFATSAHARKIDK